jgi:membrane protein DedA with SNARE-associated domain
MLHELFDPLLHWYHDKLDQGGYWLVGLLMAAESSIIPIPSETIIPFAAHLAATNGKMSVGGVIAVGTLGSWVGASVMYWASRWAGRAVVVRYGRFFMISPEKIEAAERWSSKFGSFGIFFSRLLPVVRHLIGIPAGIVRLPFGKYSLYTISGSALWCSVLAWLGIKAGEDEQLMKGDLHRITTWAFGTFLALGAVYYAFVYRQMKKTGV